MIMIITLPMRPMLPMITQRIHIRTLTDMVMVTVEEETVAVLFPKFHKLVVYTPPSKEELDKATPQEMRMSLETLIRLGGYEDTFEPLLTVILDNDPMPMTVYSMPWEDHYSLLHWAAKRTDDVRFLQLLCSKVKPEMLNIPSSDHVAMRPLHWAATEGGLPHASTLLKHGANLEGTDGAGCTPLLIAAQYGHVDLVALSSERSQR
ncbi:hypothetical protein MHU86_21522 [Fragilaria crotonensis]|nr:hypothetical protein MHU86_21522 [Fragilaria crotonensis]